MSGIPSVIIRFICHIPLGFLASNGMGMYNQMKDLGSIYDDVPHGQSFLQGARIIGGVVRHRVSSCCHRNPNE